MKVLIYGFKPYGSYETNVTEQLLAHPKFLPQAIKKVFDVEFDYAMFDKTFNEINPDIILGMGQHPRARKLRNERKAKNIYKTNEGQTRQIDLTGPGVRFANLDLPKSDTLTTTYDAGDYVCNFSMYVASEYCEQGHAKFGFLHVPRNFSVTNGAIFLNKYLKKAFS